MKKKKKKKKKQIFAPSNRQPFRKESGGIEQIKRKRVSWVVARSHQQPKRSMWLELAVFTVSLWALRWIYRLLLVKDISGQVALITGGGSGIGRKVPSK